METPPTILYDIANLDEDMNYSANDLECTEAVAQIVTSDHHLTTYDDGDYVARLSPPSGSNQLDTQQVATSSNQQEHSIPPVVGGSPEQHISQPDVIEETVHWSPPTPLSLTRFPSLEKGDKSKTNICGQPFSSEKEWFEQKDWNKTNFEAFAGNQSSLLVWLSKHRLIANQHFCTNCVKPLAMTLNLDTCTADSYMWRCVKCGRRLNIRVRSVFDKVKCPMDILLYIAYLWFDGSTVEFICSETGENAEVINNFINRLRAVCTWQLKHENERLEGVVEISEASFFEDPPIYAMAGVERFGNRCFLVRLPPKRCNPKLFLRFIRRRIQSGSTIVTSDWPGYQPLERLSDEYTHLVTDPAKDGTACKADNLLTDLHCFVSNLSVDCRKDFSSVLDEFVWRRTYGDKQFNYVLWVLAHVYNCS